MDVQVLAVRNLTYRMFVDGGRAPTVDEVAREGDLTSAEVKQAGASFIAPTRLY